MGEAKREWLRRGLIAVSLAIAGCYQGVDANGLSAGLSGTDGADGDGGDGDGGDDDGANAAAEIGPQPLHRLNRLEYNNTVRDLLHTTLRPADAFSPDTEANGFDNMADQLGITPTLFDQYDRAARDAIADALDERPVYAATFVQTELGAAGGYPVGALWGLNGATAQVSIDVPVDGPHTLDLSAGASVVGPAPQPTLRIELDDVVLDDYTVGGSAPSPELRTVALSLSAGPHTVRLVPTNFINDAVANTSNNVLVASLSIRSDATMVGPGRDQLFVCDPTGPQAQSCYEAILGQFAFRAWRRPLTAAEQTELLQLFADLQAGGESPDDALRLAMRALMLSPKFLYRMRTDGDADDGEWLDPYVLASRLSYFLWSSMPDDRLFDAASDGELSTPEGLAQTVRWMLEDDKASALADGFAEQWLSTRRIASAQPSPEIDPLFDEPLRAALAAESKLLFADFVDNERPVTEMLAPSFVYRNDRLAAHYGVPPVGSDDPLRVPVGPGDRRGLLALGAWLIANSDPDRPAPIRRGHWISDHVLCTPISPPPAGVPIEPIDPNDDDTVREQLEKHRTDPACNGCHSHLDVLGMGMQRYDAVGRFVDDPTLDSLGELVDGRTFDGADQLANLLSEDEVFASCLTEKLFTYAVGRPPQSEEKDALEDIGLTASTEQQDLPTLIEGIVLTPAFRSPAPWSGQ